MRNMTAIIIAACAAVTVVALCLTGCISSKTATISVTNKFTNDMVYVPDEEKAAEPEPLALTYTAKKGDAINSGTIKVMAVTKDAVKIHFEDGEYCASSGETGSDFVVTLGDTQRFTLVGLMDATSSVTVEVKKIE